MGGVLPRLARGISFGVRYYRSLPLSEVRVLYAVGMEKLLTKPLLGWPVAFCSFLFQIRGCYYCSEVLKTVIAGYFGCVRNF